MADLGIAHLAIREPDIMLARLQMRVRPAGQQPMPDRRMRHRDRVVASLRPLSPAVEDAQHERTGTRSGDHRATSKVRAIFTGNLYTRNLTRRDNVPTPDFARPSRAAVATKSCIGDRPQLHLQQICSEISSYG